MPHTIIAYVYVSMYTFVYSELMSISISPVDCSYDESIEK